MKRRLFTLAQAYELFMVQKPEPSLPRIIAAATGPTQVDIHRRLPQVATARRAGGERR